MLKTSIETINGELCTVIKRPFDADAVRKSLAIGVPVVAERWDERCILVECEQRSAGDDIFYCANSSIFCGLASEFEHTLTILPALHKDPLKNVSIVHKYIAEGLYPYGVGRDILVHADDWLVDHRIGAENYPLALKGAHDADGNHVEIAIKAA